MLADVAEAGVHEPLRTWACRFGGSAVGTAILSIEHPPQRHWRATAPI